MTIVNERVEHIMFGFGVIMEAKDHRIWVQFQDEIGTKAFLYPEVFERFLKVLNPTVENNVLEELHRKQERMELERKEKEREEKELLEKELEEQKAKLQLVKKKPTAKSAKKKS